jgi:hypothetical protein
MPARAASPHGPNTDLLRCPDCSRELTFVASWTVRGRWGYDEIRTYECPSHGPIFVRPETAAVADHSDKRSGRSPDDTDRDSLISVPRKPKPSLNADAIAVPEPDSD